MKIRRIFDNIEIKLICLLIAIVMWLYAHEQPLWLYQATDSIGRSNQGKITFRRIPVQLIGSERQWESNPKEISLEVKYLSPDIEVNGFRVVVRLTQEDQEERRVTLTSDNVVLPEKLSFVKAEPNEVQITPTP